MLSKTNHRVVAFGELLLRLDTPGHERFVQADSFVARYTGGEANVAAALAQWGADTWAVSKVPDHELGQACINFLRRFGINTGWVVRGPGRLGILYVEAGASQRPAKVLYDRDHTCFRNIRRGDLDWPAILRGQDWLHFTGTAPALGPGVLAVLKDGLRVARRLGVRVSFDCNYRSSLWSRPEAARVLGGLMKSVDVFIGTHHDARLLFGIEGEPAASAALLRRRFGFQAVAYTLREGLHIRIDIFTSSMSPRTRAIIDTLAYSIVLPLLAWLAWMLLQYLIAGYARGERSGQSALNLPVWPFRLVFFVSFLLFALQVFVELLKSVDRVLLPARTEP